jgi:hypothetical protein
MCDCAEEREGGGRNIREFTGGGPQELLGIGAGKENVPHSVLRILGKIQKNFINS